MIEFKNITTEYFSGLSFGIGGGAVCKIITNSDTEKRILFNIITGMKKPDIGSVLIMEKDLYSISEDEYIKLFTRVGVVQAKGGAISNLKVWENIVLPAQYHLGKNTEDMEERVISIFRELLPEHDRAPGALAAYMGQLPGPLPVHEKRTIGLVRSLLMGPELMIYDSIFEGLNPHIFKGIAALTEKYHAEKPGRTSVYLTSDEQSVHGIKADIILRQHDTGLKEQTA